MRNSDGNVIEVQIRTKRMDDIAESGLASHWSYKGIHGERTLDTWLNSVRYALEHKAQTKPEDLPQAPSGEIFCFTPSGELRILSSGSTVLDFAFNIHTNLGCRCTGARIGGKAVSIREKLKTGDVVEILTSKNQKPSSDWLNWVVTSKARNKIRQELDAAERKMAAQGREILERRLKNWKLSFPDDEILDFCKKHHFSGQIQLFAAIGRDELDVNTVKEYILEGGEPQASAVAEPAAETRNAYTGTGDDILVLNAKDVKGIQYSMARCCNPVFGDDVFGFVTRGEGIKIHRISCPNASRLISLYPYRIQRVKWQDTQSSGEFLTTLSIFAVPDGSNMGAIVDIIARFRVSLRSVSVRPKANRDGDDEITVKLLVPSNSELDKVISQIGRLGQVRKVRRV